MVLIDFANSFLVKTEGCIAANGIVNRSFTNLTGYLKLTVHFERLTSTPPFRLIPTLRVRTRSYNN